MVSLPDLDWYFLCSLLFVLYFILLRHGTILYVTVFFSVIVLFIVIYCSVFFFLLCMYSYVFNRTRCTLTLPTGVNPVAVNKYLIYLTQCNHCPTRSPVLPINLHYTLLLLLDMFQATDADSSHCNFRNSSPF